jgi:glycosyltransferase involved in cell wall biosynthesis
LSSPSANDTMTLSACLVVRNEGAVLRRCLNSVRGLTDEIVLVHDGPCTDDTLDIAHEFDCRIFVAPETGNPEYHTVHAYEHAQGKWLLSLDADEFLSPELAAVIPSLIDQDTYAGWEFKWPVWDGQRYITTNGPYKLSLFRRADTSLVGHLQSTETIAGRIGRRNEILHHQPLYNNFTLRSVFTKWKRWSKLHARQLVRPFAELPKFNYCGPDRWPLSRQVMNVLSPVLAVPNGLAHMVWAVVSAARQGVDVNLRLAAYQGLYATMLQLYVAKYVYVDRLASLTAHARPHLAESHSREVRDLPSCRHDSHSR